MEEYKSKKEQKEIEDKRFLENLEKEQLQGWETFFNYTAKNSKPMNFEKANAILIAIDQGAIVPYNL